MRPFCLSALFRSLLQPAAPAPSAPLASAAPVPVVVELFTSEGCSSCPAADALLRELQTAQPVPGARILVLGQHVDYWNRLGWRDAFSDPTYTARQRQYAAHFGTNSYTPQAVVDGQQELVGSRRAQLIDAIAAAAKRPHAQVQLSQQAGQLQVRISGAPAAGPATVLLALTETGLSTQVGRGENAGHRLAHAAVVRRLTPLGRLTANGSYAGTVPLTLPPDWQREQVQAVVLVQEEATRRIVGAGSLPLAAAQ